MSALRELIATFRIDYSGKAVKKANDDLNKLAGKTEDVGDAADKSKKKVINLFDIIRNKLKKIDFGNILGGLGVYFGIQQVKEGFMALINNASDADETMNVLQSSFKDSTQEVLNFAKVAGEEVGRSEFQLREYAGTIGAVVTPMLAKMGDEAASTSAKISTDFAKLAVDLSSFFNTSEQEAMEALRSGLTGQSEPLLKFGVVALQENLAEFAGIKSSQFTKLSQAEKTLIRYRFIMQQTVNAQGDAAKTADGFANVSRRVGGQLRDVATALGSKLLPYVNSYLKSLAKLFGFTASAIKNTKILESIFYAGAIAATIFGTRAAWAGRQTLLAWAKAALPILVVAAVIAVAILAFEDWLTALEGGESYFGDLLTWMTGVDNAGKVMGDMLAELGAAVYELFHGGGTHLDNFVNAWLDGFADIIESIGEFMQPFAGMLEGLSKIPGFGFLAGSATVMHDLAKSVRPASMSGVQNQGMLTPAGPANMSSSTVTGGNTNINLTVHSSGGNARETGRETERAVRNALRQDRRKVATAVGG